MAVAVADKWDVKQMESNDKEWAERTDLEKALFVTIQFLKGVVALGLLYIFIISLSLMGNAFKIIGGPTAGEVFRNNEIFDNPFAGCSLGILATVLVQSSSTSTSIIISMTAAGLMKPQNAMYMIMGANIGTSVTNTIISMSHIGDVDQYRRAFAGATVHDCFNLLTVAILLPLEYFFHVLYHIGKGLVDHAEIEEDQDKQDKVDFIKKLTKPVTSRLISVDKKVVTKVAQASDPEELASLLEKSMIKNKRDGTNNLFMDTPLSDSAAGWLLLIISLVMLSTTLILLVKLLQTIFRGRAAIWMQGLLNLEFKRVPFVADYILIAFGMGITILMQSSSVTTSTLTPLVGIGLIKLEKMFPFTVGANVGTTVTGILSALAGSNVATGMTVALGHLFFNIIGTVIWFPIPFMRSVPLGMAKGLGSLAADLRWFPLFYIFFTFGLMPGVLVALSVAHWAALVFVGFPILLLLIFSCCLVGMRTNYPDKLPAALQADPAFLPPSMRVGGAAASSGEGGAAQEGNVGTADLGGPNQWRQAPIAYGIGWYAVLALLMAVPNGKWADMKYAAFDSREHIGLGAWSACSKMFAEDVAWASPPKEGAELATYLYYNCVADLQAECSDTPGFSTVAGANEVYQASWQGCGDARTEDWLGACRSVTGCGDLHGKQCTNVSAAVSRAYTIDYSQTGTKWVAASESECDKNCCVPLESLCTNTGGLTSAGGLGVCGIVLGLAGLSGLLAYVFLGQSRDLRKVLWGCAAALGLAWILLLAAWATVLSAMGQDTTCYVQDDQNDGIVAATGKLGDIANGPSYGLGFVIGGWVLLNPVLVLIAMRIAADVRSGPPQQGEEKPVAAPPAVDVGESI